VLLADRIYTSLFESINLVTIRCFEGCKRCYITRLELVGGIRRETTQENIVRETELLDFEGLVRSKAIADQDASSLVRSFFGFGIKYTLEPLEADYRVGIPGVGARILPSRGRKRGPVASMGTRRLDYYRVQILTITTNAFDRSYSYALDSRTSIITSVMLTYQDFDGA